VLRPCSGSPLWIDTGWGSVTIVKHVQVSSSLAPAALGAEVLSVLSAVQASVVAFGSALCGEVSKLIDIQGVYYALLASLAVAVYYSHATAWFCSAYALLSGAPALK
jgi:hypothetical protein